MHLEEPMLLVNDVDAATSFYLDHLGFSTRSREDWGLHVLENDHKILVFRSRESMEAEFPGFLKGDEGVTLTFRSDNIDEDHEAVLTFGLATSKLESVNGFGAFLFRAPSGHVCFVYRILESKS